MIQSEEYKNKELYTKSGVIKFDENGIAEVPNKALEGKLLKMYTFEEYEEADAEAKVEEADTEDKVDDSSNATDKESTDSKKSTAKTTTRKKASTSRTTKSTSATKEEK